MKRKQMKKAIGTALSAAMVLSLAGCGAGEADPGTSEGKEENSGTVRIMASVIGGKDEEEMRLFEEALSKAVGLEVEIEKPASDYDQVLMPRSPIPIVF